MRPRRHGAWSRGPSTSPLAAVSAINYPRHFALLAVAAVALFFIEPLSFPPWLARFTFFFTLFGALHAVALVAALRAGALWRRAAFVVVTSALSGVVPYAGIALARLVSLDAVALIAAMAFGSLVGASGYWLLVRTFWFSKLNSRDGAIAVSLCVGATVSGFVLAVVLSGFGSHNSVVTDLLPTVFWWYAFSYSLWRSERPGTAANNRWRGP